MSGCRVLCLDIRIIQIDGDLKACTLVAMFNVETQVFSALDPNLDTGGKDT